MVRARPRSASSLRRRAPKHCAVLRRPFVSLHGATTHGLPARESPGERVKGGCWSSDWLEPEDSTLLSPIDRERRGPEQLRSGEIGRLAAGEDGLNNVGGEI